MLNKVLALPTYGYLTDAGDLSPNMPLFENANSLIKLVDVLKLIGDISPTTTTPASGSGWVKCSDRLPVLHAFLVSKRWVTWDGAILALRYYLDQGAGNPPEWGPGRPINLPVLACLDVDVAVPIALFPAELEQDSDTQ
jgi:hypothetical protein